MAPLSEEETSARRRVSKKLQKKRKEGGGLSHHLTDPTMELPDRLKDISDDADEDVLPPHQGTQMFMNLNQSIFGLIAAAGSTVDFNDRFEGQSSDEEDGADDTPRPKAEIRESLAKTQVLRQSSSGRGEPGKEKEGRHRRRISGQHLLRSLPQLPKLATRSSKSKSTASSSKGQPTSLSTSRTPSSSSAAANIVAESPSSPSADALSPTIEVTKADREGRIAPVMSRILEAQAEIANRPSFDIERALGHSHGELTDEPESTGPSALAQKLRDIFEFEEPEEVVDEYPCWLLQSVLVQGYMYITAKHICFYAYLSKRANEVVKSGYLSKSGKRNPKYNRYWFRLKGDVLAYYRDASNLYFPHGQIDLRYAISASVTDKDKEGLHFTVVTHHRTYHFRADSAPSAKEWVKSLQKVIFHSHNDGDSVKISLPIENVVDIEDSQLIEFADTCKIRVIDNDETYAIDEYFFSFFSFGKEAINVLKVLIEDTPAAQPRVGQLVIPDHRDEENSSRQTSRTHSPAPLELKSPKQLENVRATLAPMSPHSPRESSPRASGDFTRGSMDAIRQLGRRSLDLDSLTRDQSPRRSFSASRTLQKTRGRGKEPGTPAEKQDSTDSYVQSFEDPSSSGVVGSPGEPSEDPSASQILRGSEVFHPTIRRSTSVSAAEARANRKQARMSQATARERPEELAQTQHASSSGQVSRAEAADHNDALPPTTPTLQSLAKMGSYPLQRAGLFANYLNQTSRRMSSLLATESMGYVEKVSGMWKGGRKHYHEPMALKTDDELDGDGEGGELDADGRTAAEVAQERFRAHFALPEGEKLVATYFGHLMRVLPLYGKIYISDRNFCFRSLLPGTRTKLILPLKDIENVDKEKGFRFGYSGLVVVIRGHEELFFEFPQTENRDDCAITLLQGLEAVKYLGESGLLGEQQEEMAREARQERDALQEARVQENPAHELKMPSQPTVSGLSDSSPTILFDDPRASFLSFKPSQPLRITCLTIGSRGDVQPYISLCKGLIAEGHHARIATHLEFKGWIESYGIEFRTVDGDPSDLMNLCIQNGTFTWAFLKEATSKFRGWLDDLLTSSYEACKDSDVIIESPSAMAGIHIAEKLGVPYFRAFTMPWTRTRAYPHAFVVPEHKMGGAYNYVTYVMFDNVFWKAMASQVNRWRNQVLGLRSTNLEKMQPNKVPFLYNFSPSVVVPPLDFSDWIHVTGYWFLDEGKDWTPPEDLRKFIEQARKDQKKLVYVGFGSIIVPDPAKMTQEVIDAVLKADVRCVLSKGWSDRLPGSKKDIPPAAAAKDAEGTLAVDAKPGGAHLPHHNSAPAALPAAPKPEPVLPPEIFQIKSAPHDWLFAQMDAAAHHGGSGTTGASLRAGIPTIVRPFFGDQFFSGSRVEDLGVGICLKKWGSNSFARALWEATNSERMISKARVLGESIRNEDGVANAIQALYRDMEYAHGLIKTKMGKSAKLETENEDKVDDEEEESWTFVGGEEIDPDLVVKKSALADAETKRLTGSLGSRVLSGGAKQKMPKAT